MNAPLPLIAPLAAMALVQTMTSLAFVTVPVLAPAIGAAIGVAPTHLSIYPSVAFIGAAALTAFSGSLVRRLGGVRVNQLSLLVASTGLVAALGGNAAIIFVGALLAGSGYGLATPGASHVLARVAPPARRGLVFSIKQSAVPVGGVVAGFVLPRVAEASGWRAAVMLAIGLVIAAIPVIQPIRARLDDDREPRHPITAAAFGESIALVLRDPSLRSITGVCFSFAAVQLALFGFLVTFLVERVELGLVLAGTMFSVMQLTGIGARVLWGWASDRLIPPRALLALLGVGTIASTLAAAGFEPGTSSAWIALVAAAMGATAVGWNGVYLAEVARAVPLEKVGMATGGTLAFTFTGIVVGPSAFGAIVEATGSYVAAFVALDAVVAVSVAAMLLPRRRATS